MKHSLMTKFAAGMVALFTAVTPASAVLSIAVDMDTLTPGIQSSISVAPGATFSVDLWATIGAEGLSSFSISSLFDTTELSLNPPAGPAASQPVMPGGLAPLVAPMESNALGHVYSFNAGTLGAGPVGTSFIFGSIAFTAPTPVTNAVDDITLGYFNAPGIIDDAFDNASVSLAAGTVFAGGKVNLLVPEPTRAVLLVGGMAMMLAVRRRRSA